MAFMHHEVTDKQYWFAVDGNCGTDYVPADIVGFQRTGRLTLDEPLTEDAYPGLFSRLPLYTANTRIDAVTLIEGYGARLSAPGYLDCTEWTVFDTEAEAKAYLDEYYPEEEDEEND